MNIKNNFIKYNSSFTGLQKEKIKMPIEENELNILTSKMREVLLQRIEKELPENGKFAPISVSYTMPETQNKIKIIAEYDPIEPKEQRRLLLSSYRLGSDRMVSSYILKGTKKELMDYIKQDESQNKIIKIADELSKSVNEYYSENY